jgi:hypothetical protein
MTGTSSGVWNVFEPETSIVLGDGPLQGVRGTVLGVDESHQLIVAVTLQRGFILVKLDPARAFGNHDITIAPLVTH